MENEKRLLEIKDLTIHYVTDECVVRAVEGLNLTLDKGRTLGLVGETGAGKTTTAKGIMRLLPDPPAKVMEGKIIFDGKELLTISEKEMRTIRGNQISMIFQDPMTALNPVLVVGEQIAEVIAQHGHIHRAEAMEKAGDMLELVGIERRRLKEYPHQFSGGMKQRVVIAMALACNPVLLIADEPTTALDVTIQAQVLELMRGLKEKYDTSMLLITHDLGIVADICDNVAIMYAGNIVEYGTREDIFLRTTHPYTKGLFACIPDLYRDEDSLTPIPGLIPDPSNLPEGCAFAPRCPVAKERCMKEKPGRVELGGGHYVSCFLEGGEAEDGREAD